MVDVGTLDAAESLVVELRLPWNRIVCRYGPEDRWVVVFDQDDYDDHPDDGAPRRE